MNKENCMSYITSPNYMFKLILPKCNMVLGSYLTSVYFQIFLNICHDQTIELWKYNKCWLSQETISKNIKCARLTVNKMIGYLEQLQLIKKGKHLRHNTYELINNEQGEFYNVFSERLNKYLTRKVGEIAKAGANVIFERGLWSSKDRN